MYKVLVVDDELYVRKGIISLIEGATSAFTVCGEAENGLDALQLINKYKPDLVTVDIRMPVCDGLELIRRVREQEGFQPDFIVVSGYHDFSYAREALRYNVSDYILKPVDEQELKRSLDKMVRQLTEKHLMQLTHDKPLDNSLLDTLVSGVQHELALQQMSDQLQLPIHFTYYYVLIECHSQQFEDDDYKHSYMEKLQELNKDDVNNSKFRLHVQPGGYIGCIVYIDADEKANESTWDKLRKWFVQHLDGEVTLFISSSVTSLATLSVAYMQSYEAINHKYAEYETGQILYTNTKDKPLYYFDLPNEIYAKLLLHIEEGDIKQLLLLTDFIFQKFKDERYAPSAVKNTLTRITISIINTIRQMNGDENKVPGIQTALNWHQAYSHPEHIKQFFKQFFEDVSQYISLTRGASAKGSIDKVKQYIDSNYTENINLKSIAAKFYMNSVYLGQLFRKNYGTYFNDYLLTLRIDLAKKLLRTTDLRMYEIAEQVGFQNADYFVTQFEKKENLTPTDYRNQIMGKK